MKKYRLIEGFYLLEDEEALAKDIMPEHFIDANLGSGTVSDDYALRFMQNSLNEALHSFVNGGFSYIGFASYPIVKDVSVENIRRIKLLARVADFLDNNGYDFSGSVKLNKKRITSRDFAAILSSLYRDFSSAKFSGNKPALKPKCKELDLGSYKKDDLDYLIPLRELKDYANAELKEYLAGFYLHGSLATKDYIKGWSDVDTLAIVSKKTIENPDTLIELRDKVYRMRRFFYKIDPLQHHGSIIISEYDFENYCNAYFPLPLFNYAKSFFKYDKKIKLMARDFHSEALARMFWFVSYFRKLDAEKIFRPGSYEYKTLLHSIALFPSMYLQAKGKLVYKKFSFGIAGKDFKKEAWKAVDELSIIRKKWKSFGTVPFTGLFSRVNPLLAYRLNSKIADFSKVNDAQLLIKTMLMLSEEAWGRIKEDAKKQL